MQMISVILPTYNESKNIINLMDALFKNINQPLEIIVVDDDSPDLTWEVAGKYSGGKIKVIRREGERGLATAIRRGLAEASGDIVGWMDADMSMPAEIIPAMLKNLADHDLVIGSRYVSGGRDARGSFRVATSRVINWMAGLFLGFAIKDYDSGFIFLKKGVFDKVTFPAREGYGEYFIELIYKCKKAGFKIKEVPYTFKDRERGESKTSAGPIKFTLLGLGYIYRIISLRLFGDSKKEAVDA
ncbi:MAG TPA: polyprenol monophosphomannose synthase [Candidatus Margulisiibacteriota bacterium]|nr:polyprenol monophosphomannose synthase [Candidatus Margulisiibacteriota bacterium]